MATYFALSLFTLAIFFDLRAYRIPNMLCATFLTLGIVLNGIENGIAGALWATAAACLMLILLFPLYSLKMLGAGDVKLMMAVGAIIGITLSLWSLAWGIAIGGLLTVLFAAYKAGWSSVKKTVYRYFMCFCMRRYVKPDADEFGAIRVPYAPALALGFLITCYHEPALHQPFLSLLTQVGIH
ncbi:A24 family peptidase [Alteromonas sp. ASW11-19]|uniref:A24 family peptidase n=1 Tax=Alteromonas salexigens TaxID=2982530 RepID=A0ABT2VR36_9ALTE|nr:A24 family peptidase [Alteromonas salexigens]MCU7554878.1 A24 family peptidase [Alteromonas salexigens]